jgi:hypothetical protein
MLGRMESPFNHFFNDRIYPGTLDELTRGPLAAHLKTYAQQLRDEGYAVQTGQYQLRMLGHFNRWLQSEGFAANEIDSSTVKRFVRFREKTGKLRKGDTAALARMLRMLRAGQIKPRCPHRLRPPARLFCSSFSTTCGRSEDYPRRRLCARRLS